MSSGPASGLPRTHQRSTREVADQLPNARFAILDGQTHQVAPKALAPELAAFFTTEVKAR